MASETQKLLNFLFLVFYFYLILFIYLFIYLFLELLRKSNMQGVRGRYFKTHVQEKDYWQI